MKLTRIKIEKLFGQFDYDIKLNQDEGITILTGPNGYGKTTILKIILSLYKQDLKYLNALLFSKMEIEFSVNGKSNDDNYLSIEFEKDKISSDSFRSYSQYWKESKICFIKDRRLTYSATGKYDGTSKYDGKIRYDGKIMYNGEIEYAEAAVLNKIELFSKNLVEHISKIKSEEEKKANTLNASYAKRLLKYNEAIPKVEFEKRYEKLMEKYQLLQKYKIYQDDLEEAEYEGENRRALSIYLEDWEVKVAIYAKLLAKIKLFLSIMDGKGLTNKTFTVNAEQGFCFTTTDGKPLRLADLSSGEQHQTILLYELLFNAPRDSLVLIDEPETSMHVAWQHSFLSDLKKIRKINSASFLVATHSPSLIKEHWDWSIDLFDSAKEVKNG
jgi:predicted ATP-binding protein involved in virulence